MPVLPSGLLLLTWRSELEVFRLSLLFHRADGCFNESTLFGGEAVLVVELAVNVAYAAAPGDVAGGCEVLEGDELKLFPCQIYGTDRLQDEEAEETGFKVFKAVLRLSLIITGAYDNIRISTNHAWFYDFNS